MRPQELRRKIFLGVEDELLAVFRAISNC